MKVSELAGATLDCWVARASGMDAALLDGDCVLLARASGEVHYRPSLVWSEGGAIIEREGIEFRRIANLWEARCTNPRTHVQAVGLGETHLIAGMRAFVAARLGETTDDDAFTELHPLPALHAVVDEAPSPRV